jgi:PKD repeat protein
MRRKLKLFVLSMTIYCAPLLATDWYVRPAGGNYGLENGTSYDNAWDGLEKVVWGPGGVQAGDNLYVCGFHIHTHTGGSVGRIIVPSSGTSDLNRVVIRGDYAGDRGIIWGADRLAHEPWINEGSDTYSITIPGYRSGYWYFQDVTANSWVVLTRRSSLQDCKNNPGSFYSPNYANGSKLYVHCSDNGNPTNRIVAEMFGYDFALNNTQYITFLNLETYGHYRMFINGLDNDVVHHIRIEGCKLWYGEHAIMHLRRNTSYIEFINCDIAWAKNGLGFSEGSLADGSYAPHHCKIQGCTVHDIGVTYTDSDAHCISWQGGYDNIIENNECYNCGTGITFYLYDSQGMRNCLVRWNYIHDTHTLGGAGGRGIEFNCESGNVQDRSGNECYGNIVTNVNDTGYRTTFSGLNAEIKFFNNVAYNCRVSFYFQQLGSMGPYVVAKNNISLNPRVEHLRFSCGGAPEGSYKIDSNFNCFYPLTGSQFYFYAGTAGGSFTFTDWKKLSKSGCTFDPSSLASDPQFSNSSGSYQAAADFRPQASSPIIDAGTSVGLTQDKDDVTVPQGFAPDIGAYETVKPLFSKLSASPTSGKIPLAVSFSGYAMGDFPPFAFSWSFGDGSTSSAQNPVHTFTNTGQFYVTLTVSDSQGNKETPSVLITAGIMQKLLISTATGSPSPGEGGTTIPAPGKHEFASGTSVQIGSIQNINYRFSHWSGDVNPSDIYKNQFTLIMDKDKSATANFCVRCGDINGDLQITPADAQAAFDIFLGKLSSPTMCQRENADVNCDGTKGSPKITPADAQAIFDKYLGKSELSCSCSGNSRADSSSSQVLKSSAIRLILNDVMLSPGEEVGVPLIIESPLSIVAFGMDLSFPSPAMEFVRLEKTDYSKGFVHLAAYETTPGILRIGGFGNRPGILQKSISPAVLAVLVFRVKSTKMKKTQNSLQILNKFDDLRNASVKSGLIRIDDSKRYLNKKEKSGRRV